MKKIINDIEHIPFIHLLNSPNGKYFFDVNRNEIVSVSDGVYKALKSMLKNEFDEVGDDVKEEINQICAMGYLSDNKVKEIKHPYLKYLDAYMERKIEKVTLQLTQDCNLRCSYCIYSDMNYERQRSHSKLYMSFETAKRALNFLLEHSVDNDFVNIAFYGGEPLLSFDLLKDVVIYAEEIFDGKDIHFNLTSNGTLLNEDIIGFFIDHNINLMISIDGPAEIHNSNRRFAANGSGTFEVVYEKLDSLSLKYPEYIKNINISMVIDPQNDYECINSLFIKYDVFKDMNIYATLIEDINMIEKNVFADDYVQKENYQIFLAFMGYFGRISNSYVSKIANQTITNLQREISHMEKLVKLPEVSAPSGPCIPGQLRLFIDVDGNFYPCEKVNEVQLMRIGNLTKGFDYEKVSAILNIASITSEECCNCWAINHCVLCAKYADDNGKFGKELRLSRCESIKKSVNNDLLNMILIQEYNNIK